MIYSPENQHDMTFGNFAIFNRKYIFTHGGFSSNAMFISCSFSLRPRVVGEMPMQNVKLIARHLQKHWFDHLEIHFFAEDVLDIVFYVAGCDWFVCLFVWIIGWLVCLDNWLVGLVPKKFMVECFVGIQVRVVLVLKQSHHKPNNTLGTVDGRNQAPVDR